jgi:transposase
MLHVAEDRQKTSLDGFWRMLRQQHKESIKAVAMDTGDPFIASVRKKVPKP